MGGQERLTSAPEGEDTLSSLLTESPSSGMQSEAPFVPLNLSAQAGPKNDVALRFRFRVREATGSSPDCWNPNDYSFKKVI